MENFNNIKWSYNGTPIPAEQKLKFFKSFSDCEIKTNDILYCHLNEIDPNILELTDDITYIDEEIDPIFDPRNKKQIENFINDFSDKARFYKRISFFKKFPKSSSLTREEHLACGRFLRAKLQKSMEPNAEDVKIFEETKTKRENEYKIYLEFVKNHLLANPSKCFKDFENLYRNMLKHFIEEINKLPRDIYSLQAALPLLENIQFTEEITWECDTNLINIEGYFPKYKNYFDLYKIKFDSERYTNKILNSTFDNMLKLDSANDTNYDLIISEKALALLLQISSTTNSESEIPFEIVNNVIQIDQPLPSRYANSKTNSSVFEILLRNYINSKHLLVYRKNGHIVSNSSDTENEEIDAIDLNQEYKLKQIDEFRGNEKETKANKIISSVMLNGFNKEPLNVLIDFRNIGFLNENNHLVNLSCKLEYKKKFGLEKMTLDELIIEYIRAYFIPNSTTVRYRIDSETFEVLHSSIINKTEISREIFEIYQIKMSELLSKFYELIHIVKKFPDGKYILKYNLNFRDKFILYGQNNLENSKTICVQSLFESAGLIVQTDFLPIDNMTSSVCHDTLNIIPGCFPPWGKKNKTILNNDRQNLIKKVENKNEEIKKSIELKRRARKRIAKKAKKIRRKKELSTSENIDETLVNEEKIQYTDLLIEKYTENKTNNSTDYVSLNQVSNNKTLKTNEEFNIDKYLSDACSSSSSIQTNFTRKDYLEAKKSKSPKLISSSEIELRKAH